MSLFRGNARKQDPMVARSVEYMDERFPFWLSKVLNIGQPIMDSSVTTAAIQFDKEAKEFTFRMNPDFSAQLTDEERAFLMSHEAMHVVRNDMRTYHEPQYTDKEALNQAMDAIINDTLTNAGLVAPEWAVNGRRDVGFDCEDADLDDVYEAIVERKQQEQEPSEGDGEGEQSEDGDEQENEDANGSGSDDEGEGEDESEAGEGENDDEQEGDGSDGDGEDADGEGGADDTDGEGEGDEDEDAAGGGNGDEDGEDNDEGDGEGDADTDQSGDDADGANDESEGAGDGGDAGKTPMPMAGGGHDDWGNQEGIEEAADEFFDDDRTDEEGGHEQGGSSKYAKPEERLTEEDLPRIDFEALFRLVEPELVDGFGMGHPARADWRRPNRRTMALSGQTNLPSRRDDTRKLALASKRMELVVFLDNSGSVSPQDIAMFREIAKILPRARADYRFVVAGSIATEVSRDDMFADADLPNPGQDASIYQVRDIAAKGTSYLGHLNRKDPRAGGRPRIKNGEDAVRVAQKMVDRSHRSEAAGWSTTTEFDAMNAWIAQAIDHGTLRSYPKSVLVITDCGSSLTSASEEEASRWVVLTNDVPRPNPTTGEPGDPIKGTRLDRTRRTKAFLDQHYGKGRKMEPCRIPQENFHRLADFLLDEKYVQKKARV